MLDPKLKDWLSKGYAKLGDIGYSISLNMRKGKNATPSQRALYEQGIKMSVLLKVLFRSVTFDETTNLPILWRITEEQVNKYLKCLIELGELDKYPVVPTLFPTVKPIIINQGPIGQTGQAGTPGNDANIVVQLKPGEDQLQLVESIVAGVKTYEFSFEAYIQSTLSAVVQGSKIFEVGTLQDITIFVTSNKGTRTLTSLVADDSGVDTIFQPLVDLVQLNDEGSQPYQIALILEDQSVTKNYSFSADDGKNITGAQDSIAFYYPYLYGANSGTVFNKYTLTKSIDSKHTKSFLFNDTDKYFFICYPASYGNPSSIKDPNGFEALGAFTITTEDVTSSGLVNNWTVSYKILRTTVKTTVINGTYQIIF